MAAAASTTSQPIMCSVSAAQVEEIARLIDRKSGLIAKSRAAKHLSEIVLDEVCDKIERPRTGADEEYISVRFHKSYVDHLIWIVSELWEVSRDLDEMIDTLHGEYAEISDASFHARQAAVGRAAA